MTMSERFSRRVLAQLRLALLADCGCERTLAALDLGARQAGLTGAEIDAALTGKSFEARTAAALAFACALKAGDQAQISLTRERAARLSVLPADLDVVAAEVAVILTSQFKR